MTKAIPGVVGERSGEDGLASVLQRVGEATDELNDMGGIKGARSHEVGECVSVQDCLQLSSLSVDRGMTAIRTDTQTSTGNTVRNRADPGQLGLVDGEVGA